jgi:cytochrome c5
MLNRLLAIVLTISIAAPAIAVQAKDVLVLKTVNVVLPTSDRMFPDGPGSVFNSYCLVCHSAGMVLSQPAMTRSA